MFRLVVWINLLAAITLTIYLTFYWQRENVAHYERERRRICRIFAGCVSGPDTNMSTDEVKSMCHTHAITRCTGDSRCCTDCKAAKPVDVSLQQPQWAVINFVDAHSSFVVAIGIGISIYVIVYVALLVMRSVEEKKRTTSNVKKLQTAKCRYRKAATGILLIFGFLWLVAITTYCVSYVTSWLHTLKDCQNKLFSLLSWSIFLIFASVDYALYFIPTTVRVLTSKPLLRAVPFTTLVNAVGGILLFWWVFVGIYLEGAHRGRWLMAF